MKKYLLAAVAAIALGGAAKAQEADSSKEWVLLGLNWSNGSGWDARDVTDDADLPAIGGSHIPNFRTAGQCQAALRHVLQKYANVSHAEGGLGSYLCTNMRTWASPPFNLR
jgi:hypothetical protein